MENELINATTNAAAGIGIGYIILVIIVPFLILVMTICMFAVMMQLDKIIKRLEKLSKNDAKIE